MLLVFLIGATSVVKDEVALVSIDAARMRYFSPPGPDCAVVSDAKEAAEKLSGAGLEVSDPGMAIACTESVDTFVTRDFFAFFFLDLRNNDPIADNVAVLGPAN